MKRTNVYLQHMAGRKFAAFVLCAVLIMVAGYTVAAVKLATVVTGLVASCTAFITGHAYSDTKLTPKPEPDADKEVD